ncbi:MAG: hypothetical protein AAGB23_14035 [Pseudomonadota bacterium]
MAGRKIDRDYDAFKEKVEAGIGLEPEGTDGHYAEDYDRIVDWFKAQKPWAPDNVRVACLVVYGWMPTIFRSGKNKDFGGFAKELSNGSVSNKYHAFLNNSYVGTSKFLHFWKPEEYAIWDSRICDVLGWGHNANTKANFDKYQAYASKLAKEKGLTMRKIEQSLFLQSKTKN